MTDTDHSLTPRERLARIVAEETSDGRRIVQFFIKVAEGRLDNEGFKANHRMDAAKELVKIGLSEFEDYIQANASPPRRRVSKTKLTSTDAGELSPEIEEAREELARYARELTQDGRTVIRLYSEVMDGFRETENFKPHHRMAAARELLNRGFGPVSEPQPAAPSLVNASQSTPQPQAASHFQEPEPNPMREIFPPELMELIESDDPLDCPCADDGGDSCPNREGECPYYHLKFPEITEEQSQNIKDWVMAGIRRRAEALGLEDP